MMKAVKLSGLKCCVLRKISMAPFIRNFMEVTSLSAQYWGELWPNTPTYARFPNLLYTAELRT